MEEVEQEEVPTPFTLDNAGKGMAFLGMVLFMAYALLYIFSQAQPEFFNLFGESRHFVVISGFCIILVIGGYALTKYRPAEN